MSFSTVMVANRGEIAVRVLRTAHELGYRTVAVYSEADADAPHVALADQAVCIGPAPVGESYLDVDALLAAAERTGADAVHPGYGFLSENADFARRCAEAGLTFVGPPPEAIALMGDKVTAKRRMIEADVPTAPSYLGQNASVETLVAEAETLGLPLLVKASAGGGGRGMRKVTDVSHLAEAIASAQSEAASAFGNPEVFLERLVTGARHVEVQVFADTHGNVVHLGERECSAQRRHQKVVEEAPSPAVDAALRTKMGDAAVAAARAIGYVGAGTVEFLLDDAGDFYFLEMNTRLQVEHPVTECVTGHDLVAWQLDVAAGKALPITQEALRMDGHAIEVRLYAEDPYAGFLPQTGPIERFEPAAGLRVDAGIRSGGEVSAFYDPMLAKLIAHGRDRDEAMRKLRRGLAETVFLGPVTNLTFLQALLGDPDMIAGTIKTDTLDARFAEPPPRPEVSAHAWALAGVLLARAHALDPAFGDGQAWRSSGELRSPITLRVSEDERSVAVALSGRDDASVTVGEETLVLRVLSDRQGWIRFEIDGVQCSAAYAARDNLVWVSLGGHATRFEEPDPRAASAEASDGTVRSPLSGTVVSVLVEEGATVEKGQLLVTVEAMKMEHRIEAPSAGVVRNVSAQAGTQVAGDEILLRVTDPETESET
ncbi:MAG: biotin/lipoyl-binding protein [bacterium]|nr:biotin/lipoyl-binding protein [bacterium]